MSYYSKYKSVKKSLKLILKLKRDALFCCLTKKPFSNECAIVRLDAIGDYFLWKDHGKALSSSLKHRGFKVVIIINTVCYELVKTDFVDEEVIAIDTSSFVNSLKYRFNVLRNLRSRGFREVYHPTYSRDLLTGDSIVKACGSDITIGFDGDLSNRQEFEKKLGDKWYSRLITASPENTHEFILNTEYLNALGLSISTINAKKSVKKTKSEKTYFVIAPGATWPGRLWPTDNFISVVERILSNYPTLEGIVVGSKHEFKICEQISNRFKNKLINYAGKTSLLEYCNLISNARLVVSNESSAAHIAASNNVPAIVIVGGGHYTRFMPYPADFKLYSGTNPSVVSCTMDCYGCNWNCPFYQKGSPVPCIASVSVESVWNEVDKILLATFCTSSK